jgi:T5SS/PEP-CTERM-associated repeat protein
LFSPRGECFGLRRQIRSDPVFRSQFLAAIAAPGLESKTSQALNCPITSCFVVKPRDSGVQVIAPAVACLVLLLAQSCHGAATWTNFNSGFWKDGANWLSGRVPNSGSGATYLTNVNSKIVTIDGLTPSTNLTINSLTISGQGSDTNTLALVNVGTNNPLTLLNSGELKITGGGALTITNSALVITGSFGSGFNVWAGSVTVENGSVQIIEDPGVTNVTVKVRVGRTNAASLTINGGVLEAGTVLVAETPFAQFSSQGTIRIAGGMMSLSGELSVGEGARGNGLMEVLGGQLQIANNQTNISRVGNDGVGQLIVSNATVSLGNMSVARHDGSHGTLSVQTNGFIQFTDDLSIGRFSGATGAVFVAGGRLEVVDHPIWVGREGTGQLVVSNGLVQALGLNVAAVATNTASGTASFMSGSMILSSNLVVGSESNSIAQMSLSGGDITVTNSSASAAVDIFSGTFSLAGGQLTVDRLLVPTSAGQLAFSGGTLRTKGSVVSNGVPFVVGDGNQAATLELLGGTHTFANGIVISSNATLTGCGTILGNLTNYGTLATNCGVGPMRPRITLQPQSVTAETGGTATFSVTAVGDPPLSYQWRRNDVDLAGKTDSTLILINLQATNAGSYTVVVSNSADSVTSSNALLRVLVPPSFINVARSGASFEFSFASENALSYFIEFKTNLDDPSWTLLRNEAGNGAVISISDPIGPDATRFYRIRVE